MQGLYRTTHDRLGLTTVMVTHDMTEALLLADRIAVMREGKLLQVGTPHELLASPSAGYVTKLMSKPRQQADRVEAMLRGDMLSPIGDQRVRVEDRIELEPAGRGSDSSEAQPGPPDDSDDGLDGEDAR